MLVLGVASALLAHGACAMKVVASTMRQGGGAGASAQSSGPAQGGVLVSTGFWSVKSKQGTKKKSMRHYVDRMSLVMHLNASMVLYGDEAGLSQMVELRKGSDPALVGQELVPVRQLPPCATHEDEFNTASNWTHPQHVPSTDLGCVWSGKTSLLRRSAELHPEFDWYMWLDVGLHDQDAYDVVQRRGKSWPSLEKAKGLPKDAVVVGHSENECENCKDWDQYCHCVSGMAFIVPKALVDKLAALFTQYQEKCLREKPSWICLNDQVVMTHVRNDFPDMFVNVGSTYGAAASKLRISAAGSNSVEALLTHLA